MPDNIRVADLREDYQAATLEMEDALANPIEQFNLWLSQAVQANVKEPNAMTLATVTASGRPAARIVLLKGVSDEGFSFYTNYTSNKGKEMAHAPYAALVFSWLELEQQIRIEGRVERLPKETSTAYFQSRPKGSQIGAWASPQSQVIPNRIVLEQQVTALQEKYNAVEVLPRPEHWGGYIVIPDRIEFWQGRSSRLHDRILYTLESNGNWHKVRLAP